MPPLNDQSSDNVALNQFLVKLGFYKQDLSGEVSDKKGIMGIFK